MKKHRLPIRPVSFAITSLMIAAFACGCGAAAGAKPKDFSKAGMTITLTDDFQEKEIVSQTATYYTDEYMVVALKEEFSLFQQAGLQTDITLEDYAGLIRQNNGILSTSSAVSEEDGVTYFKYEKEVNGKNISYMATVFKGSDAYWLIQFACETQYFEQSSAQFLKWAKTAKFS